MAFEEFFMPFQFIFMQKAFLIVIILSFPTAILSCFLIIKGWALMGDAISHAVLPCLLYTSPSPRDRSLSRMPSSA